MLTQLILNSSILLTTAVSKSPIPSWDDIGPSITCYIGLLLGCYYFISLFASFAGNKTLLPTAGLVMLIAICIFLCFSAFSPAWSTVYISKDGHTSITEEVKESIYSQSYSDNSPAGMFKYKNKYYYDKPIYKMHAPDTAGFHISHKFFHPGCLIYYPVIVLGFFMILAMVFFEYIKSIVDLFR